jgi:hypothetical protein
MVAGFDPHPVTSVVADWEDAVDALSDPPMKLVITRGAP